MGYADFKARKTARTVAVTIVVNDEWGRDVNELQASITRVERDAGSVGPAGTAARQELDELQEQLDKLLAGKDDNTATFRFKGLSPDRYERLINSSPPTKEQRTLAAAQGGFAPLWNPERFMPALVHACMVEPDDWTLEDVEDLFESDEWNRAEVNALFTAALSACTDRHAIQ